jgi:type IV pilus assembly protein PilO
MRFGLRELVFFIVLLAVPAASLIYVFKPRNEDIRQAMNEIERKEATLNRLEQITSKIEDLDVAIEEGRDSIRVVEAKLPSEEGVEDILEQVWQIAKANNQTVKSVKSEKAVPAANYRELPLKMIMEGEFDGFYQFLLELEKLPRITRMHQVKLEKNSGSHKRANSNIQAGDMRAEFTLSIYFEPTSST